MIMKTFVSSISQKEFPINEKFLGASIRKSIFDSIIKEHLSFTSESIMALSELNFYRQKYLANYLLEEVGEHSSLENDVLETIANNEIITTKSNGNDIADYSKRQRLADAVATFGGSWKFIIIFGLFIVIWITSNIVFLFNKGFDPYPFILLNLILSCLAALQAPVIMMSQNRQEEKDRERA